MIMKLKTYKSLLSLCVISSFASCSDNILETVPNDRISNEIFWKSDNDAIKANNAVYNSLDSVPYYFSWDGMSDIGHTNIPFNEFAVVEIGQHDALNSTILNFWTHSYRGVQACNFYLDNVGKIKVTDQKKINTLTAEVRVLRAYFYIKLLALFGDVPLVTKQLSLEEGRSATRASASDVGNFIVDELEAAAADLPETQTEVGRITKGAAWAIQARALLYQGKYDRAAQSAKRVMDMQKYELAPSYEKLFTYASENSKEIILDKQFVKDTYRNNVFSLMAPYSQRASNSHFVPTKALVDSYQMKNGKSINETGSGFDRDEPYQNRDPRLRYSIFVKGDVLPDGKIYNPTPGSGTSDAIDFTYLSTSTGFNVKKYINTEDLAQPANGGINIILLRYAEVLLTYAEAKIELNQIDATVVEAINQIRQRGDVKMPIVTLQGDQQYWRELVRHERKVELAFEGLRYFDIRRWKIAEEVIPGKVLGMTYKNGNGDYVTEEIPSFNKTFNASRDYLWPIPQKERDINPKLSKNPNW
jgi:hypothetical protein